MERESLRNSRLCFTTLFSRALGADCENCSENLGRFDAQGVPGRAMEEGSMGGMEKKNGHNERRGPSMAALPNRELGGPVPTVWESRTVPAS